ncbi:MAG: CmpA/NrtA family ABC transporter substrate-binding protein [Pseudanabaena sp.]|jgi:bicarbonate transport system substrate-binding protein|nr:ABC transporter substrate-binding protein [Pseudanabaena sp. M090S1SP2A07QC]MCA6506967.1 ABC transporter substrate-binding protein [Pseudanabaena sp. M172S2SP2A07QC]MCA6521489.1 ABC transporter substrate-binding protein [Pseudanabaena sp. M051S1SP2A07QC]MCA6527437.1 ABC transporter substrate-binding protein [Pseudanabaena sp. M179S2SP2A07QC]MCA6530385.1 ABC transporter substrate-binding protein [Pseudanabaena sp. M125S2SP2A07QC]MCA6533857.1 ABC transporter substrate-binding protein [Pseudan
MSDFKYNISRRRFIATAGVAALSSVLLKGCLGNPPEDTPTITSPKAAKIIIPTEQVPEITKVRLGYLPIVEAAPLIVAKEKGFFDKYGMTDLEISKQANWGSARDSVKIGTSAGGIDGGQWQMPMPYLISEGIITDNLKIPMYVLLQLNTQGNAIAIADKHKNKGLTLKIDKAKDFFEKFKSEGAKFKAAYTFPKVNQEFWLRYWLAANGVDPDTDIELLTVPAAQTVANMKTGTMDAFSTGDPWPYRIVKDKIGFIPALTAEIWKGHPEEYFAMRSDWVDKYPKATKAILKAIMEAQQWCDNFDNRKELVQILATQNYFGVDPEILTAPMMGKYDMGDGRIIDDKSMATLYWKDSKGNVSYPYQSHDLWFITESVRWGFLPKESLATAKDWIKKVNREDIWREAAKDAGFPVADIPTSTSRGIEEFFDGTKFDPENPQAYLDSLKIKKA